MSEEFGSHPCSSGYNGASLLYNSSYWGIVALYFWHSHVDSSYNNHDNNITNSKTTALELLQLWWQGILKKFIRERHFEIYQNRSLSSADRHSPIALLTMSCSLFNSNIAWFTVRQSVLRASVTNSRAIHALQSGTAVWVCVRNQPVRTVATGVVKFEHSLKAIGRSALHQWRYLLQRK